MRKFIYSTIVASFASVFRFSSNRTNKCRSDAFDVLIGNVTNLPNDSRSFGNPLLEVEEIVELSAAVGLRWEADAESVRSLKRMLSPSPETSQETSAIWAAAVANFTLLGVPLMSGSGYQRLCRNVVHGPLLCFNRYST